MTSPFKRKGEEESVPTNSWRLGEWFPDLTADQISQFKKYFDELIRFNQTINLVSPKTIPFADAIHFSDSIMACRLIRAEVPAGKTIYDIGSGNGFPGLVYAILYPDTKLILVDSDQRKVEFLKFTIGALKLTNVTTVRDAVEAIPDNTVEFAISRGFAAIPKAIYLTRKTLKKGGKYFHMKSEEWATEVAQIPTQLCSFWHPGLLGEYKLPVGQGIKFAVVKTDKIT